MLFFGEDETGLGAELAAAQGKGLVKAGGEGVAAGLERAGKDEDRVGAAHFGVDGDGVRAVGGDVHERPTTAKGAGEADGADAGMLDEQGAYGVAAVEEDGKGAVWKAAGADRVLHDESDQFTGAGMRGVGP